MPARIGGRATNSTPHLRASTLAKSWTRKLRSRDELAFTLTGAQDTCLSSWVRRRILAIWAGIPASAVDVCEGAEKERLGGGGCSLSSLSHSVNHMTNVTDDG